MNGAGAWPGYMVNQDYVEGGKNYSNDTPEKATEIRTLLRDKRFRDALHGLTVPRDRCAGAASLSQAMTLSPQSGHFTVRRRRCLQAGLNCIGSMRAAMLCGWSGMEKAQMASAPAQW